MPRPLRPEFSGAVHHVWARGNNRQLIFIDDEDRAVYVDKLARTVRWKRWRCLAYCLMPNHVHLLVETPEANLGAGMQWFHGSYAREFNDRHARVGHVFQGRFGNKIMLTDEQLWTAAAYVARNPVEAGLVERAEEWRWGSHAAVVAGAAPDWLDVERLAGYFGGLGNYLDHVARLEPAAVG